MAPPSRSGAQIIEIDLQDLGQLFNSMDPTPFPVKDLDRDAEEFLVSWAREYPLKAPLRLRVHLHEQTPDRDANRIVAEAVHHYFGYRADLSRRDFRQLMRRGRVSLVVGLLFLASCQLLSELLKHMGNPLGNIAREGLVIGGWVAMWRPLEILLYDWWPLRASRRVFEKLASIDVEVTQRHVEGT